MVRNYFMKDKYYRQALKTCITDKYSYGLFSLNTLIMHCFQTYANFDRFVSHQSLMCITSPDPLDILLRKQPPAVTASFYQKMKFLIEESSVQSYAHKDEYSER
jgi:hypothetical protein